MNPITPSKKDTCHLLTEIIDEIYNNKWLIYQFFKRDFIAGYKQTFLGVFWALLIPLIAVSAFIFLNKSGILVYRKYISPLPCLRSIWYILLVIVLNHNHLKRQHFSQCRSNDCKNQFFKKITRSGFCRTSHPCFCNSIPVAVMLFYIITKSIQVTMFSLPHSSCSPYYFLPLDWASFFQYLTESQEKLAL